MRKTLFVSMLIIIAFGRPDACGEPTKTFVASFRDSDGVCLSVKSAATSKSVVKIINDFDQAGFSLDAFSSINDVGDASARTTVRYTIVCRGVRPDNTFFTEETGGFADSLMEAIAKARQDHLAYQKEFTKGEKIELLKIMLFEESLQQEGK